MHVQIPIRKLEDTIVELNQDGYVVVKSKIEGDNITLTAKKVSLQSSSVFKMNTIWECEEVKKF